MGQISLWITFLGILFTLCLAQLSISVLENGVFEIDNLALLNEKKIIWHVLRCPILNTLIGITSVIVWHPH